LIQSALGETDRLSKLNKTLLLLSKIDNEQFIEKGSIDVAHVVSNVLISFDEKKDKLALTVESMNDGKITVIANPILTEVLIGNLIENAFVHNINRGKVRIFISSSALIVENSGDQMPEAERLFERFYNAGSEGWGLGLAIVKRIVELNHWDIRYAWNQGRHIFRVIFQPPSDFNQN
jgi:signal transduction histidine kinase